MYANGQLAYGFFPSDVESYEDMYRYIHKLSWEDDEDFEEKVDDYFWKSEDFRWGQGPMETVQGWGEGGPVGLMVRASEQSGSCDLVDLPMLYIRTGEFRLTLDQFIEKHKLEVKPDTIGWHLIAYFG